MGQDLSLMAGGQNRTAVEHAARGWPAFMTGSQVVQQMHKFRMRKSLMGARVRFLDSRDGCIEYVLITRGGGSLRGGDDASWYQRVDGPCNQRASVPTFPDALTGTESMPLVATATGQGYKELTKSGTSRCASYRQNEQGVWIKVGEDCRETKHRAEVKKQQRR